MTRYYFKLLYKLVTLDSQIAYPYKAVCSNLFYNHNLYMLLNKLNDSSVKYFSLISGHNRVTNAIFCWTSSIKRAKVLRYGLV